MLTAWRQSLRRKPSSRSGWRLGIGNGPELTYAGIILIDETSVDTSECPYPQVVVGSGGLAYSQPRQKPHGQISDLKLHHRRVLGYPGMKLPSKVVLRAAIIGTLGVTLLYTYVRMRTVMTS